MCGVGVCACLSEILFINMHFTIHKDKKTYRRLLAKRYTIGGGRLVGCIGKPCQQHPLSNN